MNVPALAALNAPQSFAPSPHIPTWYPICFRSSINKVLSTGDIRAYTLHDTNKLGKCSLKFLLISLYTGPVFGSEKKGIK